MARKRPRAARRWARTVAAKIVKDIREVDEFDLLIEQAEKINDPIVRKEVVRLVGIAVATENKRRAARNRTKEK